VYLILQIFREATGAEEVVAAEGEGTSEIAVRIVADTTLEGPAALRFVSFLRDAC
jgi:hypothetical protein